MSEWKDAFLGDFISHKKGFAFKSNDLSPTQVVPVVKLSNTKGSKIDILSCDKVNYSLAQSLLEYRIYENDVIVATVGSWPSNPASVVGKIIKVDKYSEGALLNQNAVILRTNSELNQFYLYYLLRNKDFQDYIVNTAQGSANQASITLKDIFSYSFNIPLLNEQESIAEVLSSLDDKIDLLHRNNKTLEQLAETLFRQWFVEEADENWAEVRLGDYISVYRGLSYKGAGLCDKFTKGAIGMVNLNSVYEGGGYKDEGIKYYCGEYRDRHMIYPGDLIITNTEQGHEYRLIGFGAIVPKSIGEKGIFSQHIYRVIPKPDCLSTIFLYHLINTSSVREQIIGATNGSTVNMLPLEGIERVLFRLPPDTKFRQFDELATDIQNKIEENNTQIQQLESLRDTLLPKLMSGSVRVTK